MRRLRDRIIRWCLVLSTAVLPATFIECDLEDGEFKLNLPKIRYDDWYSNCCDYGGWYFDFWYDPYYYYYYY